MTVSRDLDLSTSIYEIKDQYAKQTSLAHEKIKVLFNKKPAADLKTLKELGVSGDVEFSLMILGGGGATPSGGTPKASSPAVEKADPADSAVTVELLVASTEPGLQGDRSSAGTKPATMETGAEIQVPLFINTGDKLKVDSRDGSYLGRVNA